MSGFKSDAQRKHFFANNGGGSSSSVPSFPGVGPGQYVHTITVCGVEKHIVCEESDRSTPEEDKAISDKEDRKANDMQQIMGGR